MTNPVARLLNRITERRGVSPHVYELLGAGPTYAGPDVSEMGSLRSTAVYACVRIISESIASLPLALYRQRGRDKERALDHNLWPVLHDLANPEMTSMEWREYALSHVLLWGNHWSEIEYDGRGRVVGLWPLRPDKMEGAQRRADGLWWAYRMPDNTLRWIPAARLHHLRGLTTDGVWGLSPIRLVARQAIGLSLATEEFGSRFFSNGARPGLLLKHPGKLSPGGFERLRASFAGEYQGLTNAHKVKILEEGMDISTIGIPPDEAQFLETRKFQVTEIARVFRVPPHLLADLDRATFSNIEHQSLEFVMHTLRPWLVRHEQTIARDLLTPAERSNLYAKYIVEGLLRGDTVSRYQAYATGIVNGFLTRNEARELEDWNPIDGLDEPLVPLNMVEVSMEPPVAERAEMRQLEDGELKPTEAMRSEAQRGLDWRAEFGRGGTEVGVARARDIINNRTLSPDTWRRMHSYFSRHEVDKQGKGFSPGEDGYPSAGRIAWALWGGDAGQSRARAIVARLDAERHEHDNMQIRAEVSDPQGWTVREERVRRDRQAMMNRTIRLWQDASERLVKRETADIRRAIGRYFGKRDAAGFETWLERFYEEMREWLPDYFRALMLTYAETILAAVADELEGEPIAIDDGVRAWVEAYLTNLAATYTVGSEKQLRTLIAEAEGDEAAAEAIEERMAGWTETKPEKTALEQTFEAGNALAILGYARLGIEFLRWSARGESCPLCRKLDGRRIPIQGAFVDEGDTVEADGVDPLPIVRKIKHGPLHSGCDCVVIRG